ncbi:uncharacterized protein LODBEIA_P33880 [Lodderomyces beijingensis]|uniref:Beta-hexosaminidase n=1 Tax=Lodderomyces beijingensis TaxID=1775926 RepID=A0ABP0ZLZ5_9ASCO
MFGLVWYILLCSRVVFAISVDPLPRPHNVTWFGDSAIVLDLDAIELKELEGGEGISNSLVQGAFERAVADIKTVKWSPYLYSNVTSHCPESKAQAPNVVTVAIADYDADLQFGVDESYELHIDEGGINISSETIWGTLHALTTLQQMVVYQCGQYFVEQYVHIQDYPLFKHRGLMVDSARNFLPVNKIMEQIELMALSKMNTLHWHLVDSQSWPVEIASHPEMTQDAYSAREVYTQKDVLNVVNFARSRGVRLVPEIDMPGHARAGWRKVDPDIVECADVFWTDAAVEPPPGQLNIMNNETYFVIGDVYHELSNLFHDHYFHVGNDELQKDCYPNSWYDNATLSDITQHYIDRALPIYNSVPGRQLVMWDDVLLSDGAVESLPSNVTLQTWHEVSGVKNLTSRGYNVIVSSSDHLYLDCGYGGFLTNDWRYIDASQNVEFNTCKGGSWCGPYKTWQRIYTFDFLSNLTQSEQELVVGAEAVLWSEQVDFAVLTGKIWPRASALGESLWSGNKNEKGEFRLYEMSTRIVQFREYMVSLGFAVSPLVPRFCLFNPHACDAEKPPNHV